MLLSIEKRVHLFLVVPAVVLLAALTIYPTAYSVKLALLRFNLARPWIPQVFLGLGNFSSFLSDTYLHQALLVTLKFGAVTVILQLVIGFLIASLLSTARKGNGLFRVIYLIPMMVVPVVAGLIWKLMLNHPYGVVNWLLANVGIPPQLWLGPDWALASVVVAETWQWLPFSVLIFSVALASIPREYYEAAAVDGASAWDTFLYITLPNLRWAILIVSIFKLSDAVKAFDVIYAMTGGGPGISTQTLALYIYRTGFTDFEMGYAAALSFLILFILLIILSPFVSRMGAANETD